jgi:hypothetical protein
MTSDAAILSTGEHDVGYSNFLRQAALYRDNLDGKAATVRMVILAVAAGVMIVAARR